MIRYFLLLLVLMSCSTTKKQTLLLDWLPNPNHIPLYVGVEKGLFQKHGIHLEILKAAEVSNGVGYVSLGQVDYALTYMHSFVRAKEEGAPIQMCAKLIDKPLDSLIFVQDGTIETPHDLSGKRLGYAIDSTTDNLDRLLYRHQIYPQELVNCHFDLVGMMLTGRVDAIYGGYYTVEGVQLEEFGLNVGYFPLDALGFPSYYELVVMAKQGKDESAFQSALEEAIAYTLDHPEESFTLYASLFPEKSAEVLAWEKKSWEKTLEALPKDQHLDDQVYMNLKNWLLEK